MAICTEVDYVIIGAGVLGAAVAQKLCELFPRKTTILFEEGLRAAEGVTSRNSGVIHAGIYYPPGSLKAETCVRGNKLLYEWVKKNDVPFSQCGKLIVARGDTARQNLEALYHNAQKCGVGDLELIDSEGIKKREPSLQFEAAIWSPSTGIVDPAAFTKSLLTRAQQNDLIFLPSHKVTEISQVKSYEFILKAGTENIRATSIINCAGLFADEVAKLAGVEQYTIYPCRGDYFSIRTNVEFSSLIYPVKDPGSPGLGVHLTIDLDGKYRLGPDTEYVDSKQDFSPRENKKAQFEIAARKILGDKIKFDLQYDTCGIRPKLRSPSEQVEKDFIISEDAPGLINLVGIESPGLTASLALAEKVVARIAN